MSIAPSWGYRVSFVVTTNSTCAELSYIRHEKPAGLIPGRTRDPGPCQRKYPLSAAQFAEFEMLVRCSGYREMSPLDPEPGLDGSTWTLSVRSEGQTSTISRWSPGVSAAERNTAGFIKPFRWCAEQAGVTHEVTNKGVSEFRN